MISNNDKISPYQLCMIVIMTVVGVGVFSLPSSLAKTAGTDAWVMVLLGGLVNICAALVMVKLNSRFPGKTLVDYIQDILGVAVGKIVGLLFAATLIIIVSLVIRSFTEVVRMFLLFRTPTEVIILSLVLTCTYLVRGGVECIGRIMEISFPMLFIPFALIMLPGLGNVEFNNLLPFMQDFSSKLLPSMPVMLLSFGGFETILFYGGFLKQPQKAYKSVILALGFVTIFYAVVTAICVANFGEKLTPQITWPVIMFIKGISFPGLFIERLEGVALALWVLTVFTTIVSIYYVTTYTIAKVLNTKEQKQYVLPLAIFMYYIALQPKDLGQMFKWLNQVSLYAESIIIYALPVILLAIAYLRGLGGEGDGKAKTHKKTA